MKEGRQWVRDTYYAQAEQPGKVMDLKKDEFYSVEQASMHAAEWCKKHPAWMRICDLDDTACYSVQWKELSERERNSWGSEYGYNEFATKRQKVKAGFISGKGEFFSDILDIPRWHNSMMVFCVGIKAAQELRDARILAAA